MKTLLWNFMPRHSASDGLGESARHQKFEMGRLRGLPSQASPIKSICRFSNGGIVTLTQRLESHESGMKGNSVAG
jgi:hypothetical protein